MEPLKDIILQLDHAIWLLINSKGSNALFDVLLPPVRNQWFWSPLYLFLLIYMPKKYKKMGWLWCLGFLLTFIIADRMSAGLFKPYFHRLRPCHNDQLKGVIHLLVDCGGSYGFPSSHASNHFGLAIYSGITLYKNYKWIWAAGLFWAVLVSYAQIYVGVHYPLDVAFGACIGLFAGVVSSWVMKKTVALDMQVSSINTQ